MFRGDVFLHPSAIVDYKVAAINGVLGFAIVGLAGFSTLAWTKFVRAALAAIMGSAAEPLSAGAMSGAIYSVALFLTYDGGNFVQHYLQHRIPLLWEFHKVHHSAEVLTPITALRVHPISDLFISQLLAVFFGLTNGVFLYLFAGKIAVMTVAGANVLFFLHYTIGVFHLQHSHVWIVFPPMIREIFMSPAMHIVHHSRNPAHYGKNFAFGLTIWDRFAGTMHMPKDEEENELVLGLDSTEQDAFKSVRDLYFTPLRRIIGPLRAMSGHIDGQSV